MSLGYAEQLSYREEIGTVGQAELLDSPETVESKSNELADMIAEAGSLVVMTGAGISTSCGIPDFRGPNGVWTCQKQGRPLPKLSTTFLSARPSYTHMALVALAKAGKLRFVISQNVDGLHARSGLTPSQLAELHGNCFAERCPVCNKVYIRDFEMNSVGFKPTGRSCSEPSCRGRLRDFILDWEDALPDDRLSESEQHAADADVILCLGTSLQIRPVCQIPLLTKKGGGRIAIVNLQKTPKHRSAALVVHARCDDVMRIVMRRLEIAVPPFVRREQLRVSHFHGEARPGKKGGLVCDVVVQFESVHGAKCPMPLIEQIRCRWGTRTPKSKEKLNQPANTSSRGGSSTGKSRKATAEAADEAHDDWEEQEGGDRTGPMVFKATVPVDDTDLSVQIDLNDAADDAFRQHTFTLCLHLSQMGSTPIKRGRPSEAQHVSTNTLALVSQVKAFGSEEALKAAVEGARRNAIALEPPVQAATLRA